MRTALKRVAADACDLVALFWAGGRQSAARFATMAMDEQRYDEAQKWLEAAHRRDVKEQKWRERAKKWRP